MKRLLTKQRGMAAIFIILIILGVIVVGIVAAGAIFLSNDVTITVNNQSCGTLDIAKGLSSLNFLPGINVPSQIAQGDTAEVQIPKRFVNSVTIEEGIVDVEAFSRSFTLGTSNLDMQRSTWDGTPLTALVGQQVKLSGKHTLMLECK